MLKKYLRTKRLPVVVLTLALAVFISACTPQPPTNTTTDVSSDQNTATTTPAQDEVTVILNTQNNSGQTGTAVFKSEGANTRVTIALQNTPPNIAQPAHIHVNSCATIGGIEYPLTALVNGASETVVPATLNDLTSKEQLSINIHKSADEVKVYTACGDLPYFN